MLTNEFNEKDIPEEIVVEKDFFLKLVKQVMGNKKDIHDSRVLVKDVQRMGGELQETYIGKIESENEVLVTFKGILTNDDISMQGENFRTELQRLISRYGVNTLKVIFKSKT